MKIPKCPTCHTSQKTVQVTVGGNIIAPGWHHEPVTIRNQIGEIVFESRECCLLVISHIERNENKYVEHPPKLLAPPGWVPIEIVDREMARSSKADIAFLQHLRATKGFIQKMNHSTSNFHAYIEPKSEAAYLFARWLMKSKGLPAHHEKVRELVGGNVYPQIIGRSKRTQGK